ncbi:MAG: hypothetical protein KZQ89_02790 [Candidatus Thiodiazotropha sp. (ex Lucinoma kastoroae)]|nr:hypothetical protein [Candidatus Thiodiazotropha sp. (ex Lucinoma kastoroae)]
MQGEPLMLVPYSALGDLLGKVLPVAGNVIGSVAGDVGNLVYQVTGSNVAADVGNVVGKIAPTLGNAAGGLGSLLPFGAKPYMLL